MVESLPPLKKIMWLMQLARQADVDATGNVLIIQPPNLDYNFTYPATQRRWRLTQERLWDLDHSRLQETPSQEPLIFLSVSLTRSTIIKSFVLFHLLEFKNWEECETFWGIILSSRVLKTSGLFLNMGRSCSGVTNLWKIMRRSWKLSITFPHQMFTDTQDVASSSRFEKYRF